MLTLLDTPLAEPAVFRLKGPLFHLVLENFPAAPTRILLVTHRIKIDPILRVQQPEANVEFH